MNWITDRPPTEADGDKDGDVFMRERPGSDQGTPVHWSYVGAGVPWRRSVCWESPSPAAEPAPKPDNNQRGDEEDALIFARAVEAAVIARHGNYPAKPDSSIPPTEGENSDTLMAVAHAMPFEDWDSNIAQIIARGLRSAPGNDGSTDWMENAVGVCLGAISDAVANFPPAPAPTGGELAELVAGLLAKAVQAANSDASHLAGMLTWAAQVVGEHADLLERQVAPVPVGMIPMEYADLNSRARIVSEPSEEGPGGCWVVLNSRLINPLTEFPTAEAAWNALQAAHALPLP